MLILLHVVQGRTICCLVMCIQCWWFVLGYFLFFTQLDPNQIWNPLLLSMYFWYIGLDLQNGHFYKLVFGILAHFRKYKGITEMLWHSFREESHLTPSIYNFLLKFTDLLYIIPNIGNVFYIDWLSSPNSYSGLISDLQACIQFSIFYVWIIW